MAGRVPTGAGVQRLYAAIERALPSGLEDRRFGQDVEAARGVLRDRAGQLG
jgi:hypothetical protein